jgi:hypothetical protein
MKNYQKYKSKNIELAKKKGGQFFGVIDYPAYMPGYITTDVFIPQILPIVPLDYYFLDYDDNYYYYIDDAYLDLYDYDDYDDYVVIRKNKLQELKKLVQQKRVLKPEPKIIPKKQVKNFGTLDYIMSGVKLNISSFYIEILNPAHNVVNLLPPETLRVKIMNFIPSCDFDTGFLAGIENYVQKYNNYYLELEKVNNNDEEIKVNGALDILKKYLIHFINEYLRVYVGGCSKTYFNENDAYIRIMNGINSSNIAKANVIHNNLHNKKVNVKFVYI